MFQNLVLCRAYLPVNSVQMCLFVKIYNGHWYHFYLKQYKLLPYVQLYENWKLNY